MLLVQKICLQWNKEERGVKGENVRRQFPQEYLLEELPLRNKDGVFTQSMWDSYTSQWYTKCFQDCVFVQSLNFYQEKELILDAIQHEQYCAERYRSLWELWGWESERITYETQRRIAWIKRFPYNLYDVDNIKEIESYAIKGSGYDVRAFDDAEAFDRGMQERKPDLLLLDVMLPGEDGLSVLKRLRSNSDTKELPVILVTAKDSEIDTVRGLDLGADDYITKPFGVMELMSRIKAIMRRVKPTDDDVVLKYKNIYLDQDRRTCLVDEENVELTFKEYELLRLFLCNLGIVLTREVIMDTVWGTDFAGESRTIDMHIKTLRRKLKEAGSLIITVRNVGYKLE